MEFNTSPENLRKKCLIFGIDGTRSDCILKVISSNDAFAKVKENSAYHFKVQTCKNTISAPCWTSILCGVEEEKHKINMNELVEGEKAPPISTPSIFSLIREAKPELEGVVISAWDGLRPICNAKEFAYFEKDEDVEKKAINLLKDPFCPDLIMLHFDGVDDAGHGHGYGLQIPQYMDSIAKVEKSFAEIYKFVNARRNQYNEDWLIVICTDHGGSMSPPGHSRSDIPKEDKGYHGDNIPEHREVFIMFESATLRKGEIFPNPQIFDIVPTILFHFGVVPSTIKASLDGRVISALPYPHRITILQFTDVHRYDDGKIEDQKGSDLMRKIAERVKPDLVVLTGDILDGQQCKSVGALKDVVKPFIDLGIKWAYVPGNHDDESPFYNRKDLLDLITKEPLCLTRNSNSFDNSILLGKLQVFLLDSNAYALNDGEDLVYDFIHKDQIQWFEKVPKEGDVSIAFFHIPVPEYNDVKILRGSKKETVCCPKFNSGFFDAAKKRGNFKAMFVGHDHLNNYVGEKDGIWLVYGNVTGFTEPTYYFDEENQPSRGGRVISYNSVTKELSTWIESPENREESSFISVMIDN